MEKHESLSFRKYHVYEDDEIQFTGSTSEIADYLGYQTRWVHYLANNNRIIEKDGRTIRLVVAYDPVEAEFAMYKGEDLIAIGTLEEIADQTGKSLERVKYYRTPKAKRMAKQFKKPTVLVSLDGEYT